MKRFYKIWLFSYNLFCKYSVKIEDTIFLSNYNNMYRYNSYYRVSFIKRYILLLFYTPLNLRRVTIFFNDLEKIYDIRLHNYTIISTFFSLEMQTHKSNVVRGSYTYSCFKFNQLHYANTDVEFMFGLVNLTLLDNIRFISFWTKANNSPDFFGHVKSRESIVVYNNHTLKGFAEYISSDFTSIVNKKIFNEDVFFNRMVKLNTVSKVNVGHKLVKRDFNKILNNYNKFFLKLEKFKSKDDVSFVRIFEKFWKHNIISVEFNFKNFYSTIYPVKYKPTDATQYLTVKNNMICLFLRKNKVFNKGRYSRNRQLYRTGVYWCLWLNIINVFGLYYYFYRFVFNFGYFYIPLLLLILSIFGSRLIKYRFYIPSNILNEVNIYISLCVKFYNEILVNFYLRTKFLIIKFAKWVYYCFLLFWYSE